MKVRRYMQTRLMKLAIACLAASSTGCASPLLKTGTNGASPTEITYWTGWSGHELETQQGLVEEFNKTHPAIHVRILSQFGSTGYQKVRIAFAGGATPDVMSTVWADELAAYAERGVLTPLDRYLAGSGRDVNREYPPGIAHMVTIKGHVYGTVVTNGTSFIAYNKSVFRSAGLDPSKPPQTIDELDADAAKCTVYDSHGDFARYGFRPGGVILWAYAFGGGWYDAATDRITANSPANVRALEWMASYAKHYDLKRMQAFQLGFGSSSTPNGPFYVGKVAMEVTGEWEREFAARYAPNLDWGWCALPSPPGGRVNATTTGGSVFVIPAGCKHKDAAWTFLNWMSSPHAVKTFCAAIHNLPPLLSVCADPVFKNDPLYAYTIPIANGPNAFGPPPTPIWPTYSREISRVEERAILGGEDPKTLLDNLQAKMELEKQRTEKELTR